MNPHHQEQSQLYDHCHNGATGNNESTLTSQLQACALNNRGVSLLKVGAIEEANTTLTNALTLMTHVINTSPKERAMATTTSSSQHQQPHLPPSSMLFQESCFPLRGIGKNSSLDTHFCDTEGTTTTTTPKDEQFYIYDRPLVLLGSNCNSRNSRDDTSAAAAAAATPPPLCCAVVAFNLGLIDHCRGRFQRATLLYQMTLQLLQNYSKQQLKQRSMPLQQLESSLLQAHEQHQQQQDQKAPARIPVASTTTASASPDTIKALAFVALNNKAHVHHEQGQYVESTSCIDEMARLRIVPDGYFNPHSVQEVLLNMVSYRPPTTAQAA